MSDISKITLPNGGGTYDLKDQIGRNSTVNLIDHLSSGAPGARSGRNIIPYPYTGGNLHTHNGVTFLVNPDTSISITGSIDDGQDYAWFDIIPYGLGYNRYIRDKGKYRLTGAPAGGDWYDGNRKWMLYLYTNESGSPTAAADKGQGVEFTAKYVEYVLRIIVGKNGYNANNNTEFDLTFKPMIVPTYIPNSFNSSTGTGYYSPTDCSYPFNNKLFYTFAASSGNDNHFAKSNYITLRMPLGGTGIFIGGQFGNSMIGSRDGNAEIPEGEVDGGLPYIIAFVGGQGSYSDPQPSNIRIIKKQDAVWKSGSLAGHTTSVELSQKIRKDNFMWVTMRILFDGKEPSTPYFLQGHIIFLPNVYKLPFIDWDDISTE